MKSRTNKFRNIFKMLPITFLLFGIFTFINRTVNQERVLPVSATSAAYGEFSLPDEEKWIYVHSSTGSDTSSRTGRSISSPLKTIARAVTLAEDGDAIMLLSSFYNLSTPITIDKHVIIASSPTNANGVPITYVHNIERSTSSTNDMFRVNAGGELHLSRVYVHGKRTLKDEEKKNGALVYLGSGDPTNPAKFYLHSGATLSGGNRTAGGSAVLLFDGIFYMNGGVVQSNYTPGSYTLIGALEGSTHNEAYLIAGEVRNNTGAGNFVGIRHSSFKEIVIGGDFVVKNNETHESGDLLPHYGALNVKIINNFTERTKFYATAVENSLVTIVIVDEDFVPLETQPDVVMFYESYSDAYLYPHYINGKYYWKYFYNEDFSVVTKPTATTAGVLARQAHINDDAQGNPIYSDTSYVDEIVLPVLNTTDYDNITFHSDTDEITYEYVHAGETFVLTYPAPANSYVWRVTKEATLTSPGEIVLEHPDYPGVIFETVTLPSLSVANYTSTVTDDDVIYTYTDASGATHEIKVSRPEDSYSWEVTSEPTLNGSGSAILTHPDFPDIVFMTEALPKLDSEDYVVTLSGNQVIYSYGDDATGLTISFSVPLPSEGFATEEVTSKPTTTATGTAIVTNPAVPGLEIVVTLPKLSTAAYTVTLSGENAIYTYIDPNTNHEITFTLPLPEEGYREAEVTSVPTTTEGGTAVVSHPEIPGVEIAIELPKLSGDDYTVSHDETSAIYTYVDDETGFTVDVIISLPEDGYSAPTLKSSPTASEAGTATVTHPELPDLEITLDLPKLNAEDYVITVSDETVIYTYTDEEKAVDVTLTFPLPEDGYNDPTVTVNPTPTTTGVAIITHPDLPGFEITIEVPKLSADDYDVNVTGGEVIYTTTTPDGETVTVTIALPEDGYSDAEVSEEPSVTAPGTATVTHPDLPGATIEIELPALNGEDYDVAINVGDDFSTGVVVYTYTDADTDAEVTIEVPYDYDDLTWAVNEQPTLDDGGTITGTNTNLPGATFEHELPALNAEDYEVTDNDDGTLTYTLKDKTYGNFAFTVAGTDNVINLWWLIIIEIVLIIGLAATATLKILHDKKGSEESTASMHALPLLFFAKYIPNGAIAIVIILAVIILLGAAFVLYLFLFRAKSDKVKEETKKAVKKKTLKR